MVQAEKKIALLHRHPQDRIRETNAAFPYLKEKGIDVLTFKTFSRTSKWRKFFKSLLWILYAPLLVIGKNYDVIYCDDSYPFYPIFLKLVSPKSKVVLRIGDFHLMYNYSGLIYQILHFFEKIGWRMADQILAISGDMGVYFGHKRFFDVRIVFDPVDPKDFIYSEKKNHGTVMFHGLLVRNKNVDVMIEAAKKLPNIIFIIIGDGPDKKRLESIAPNNVIFKGWIPFDQIKNYISTCAIGLALRSNNPGNDYVVTSPFLQYGVSGKPCIVSRRKVFGNYEWQFSNVDELVLKIMTLMPKAEYEGKKLREYVLKNHDAKQIAERIWEILLSV